MDVYKGGGWCTWVGVGWYDMSSPKIFQYFQTPITTHFARLTTCYNSAYDTA